MSFAGSAGVIGWPVGHSRSPIIHRFWLARLGLDGDYGRFAVAPDRLEHALRALPALGLRGVNVTVPHKQAARAACDELDPFAARVGAVNTVIARDGALVGYNTDGPGFLEPLRPLLAQRWDFRMARIIGTGGAALGIAHALAGEGFTIALIGRDAGRAAAVHASLDRGDDDYVATLDSWRAPLDFDWQGRDNVLDLVINATTLGMAGQPELGIHFSHVPPGAIVYDIVYAPLETPLLAEARGRGLRTVDGLSMLIGQAAIAFELFFGHPAPREHDEELRRLLMA